MRGGSWGWIHHGLRNIHENPYFYSTIYGKNCLQENLKNQIAVDSNTSSSKQNHFQQKNIALSRTPSLPEEPKTWSPAYKRIPNGRVANILEEAVKELFKVKNKWVKKKVFLEVRKESMVACISKKGSDTLSQMCLLPSIGRVLDAVLTSLLTYYLKVDGMISER